MTRKEIEMQARINAMAKLLSEIQELAKGINPLDRVKTGGTVGEIKYLSSENTIAYRYQMELSRLYDIEWEKEKK